MTPELDVWIDFYFLLRCQTLAPVRGMMLRRAKITEPDLEIILMLDAVWNKWEREDAPK
jgi:hypothetical protein